MTALDGPPYDQSREFVPSKATENALATQLKLAKSMGKKGREIIRDVDAYTAGINANFTKNHPGIKLWTRNDTIAAAAVLAGQYGVGGGDEARRAELLAELQAELGPTQGRDVWNDLREQQDPETPPTATRSFPYGASTSEDGNVALDAGSLGKSVERAGAEQEAERGNMSNAILVTGKRSTTRHPIFVAGPQVGYFYPAFFLELDLHGGGFNARGAVFPGVPWIVVGRGPGLRVERNDVELGHRRPVRGDSLRRRRLALHLQGRVPGDGHVRRGRRQGHARLPDDLPHDRARPGDRLRAVGGHRRSRSR